MFIFAKIKKIIMKTYKPTFTQEDAQNIAVLFDVAIKTLGLKDNADIAARNILNKITASEVKSETPL